jgi:pimeloyl-ACP methyl ester carboxylesterase
MTTSEAALSPFELEITDAQIDDLRARLANTRWPEAETVSDWSQGIPLAYTRELCEYWGDAYDMQRLATQLNRYEQFHTEIDGIDIHFLHVRSPAQNATPLIMTHGWPGSVVEFLKVIEPLSAPKDPDVPAFHLVIPSLPGYGFSGKPTEVGWDLERIARAWATLMARLGYDRYAAQGGDWGSMVTTILGYQDVAHVTGIHLNLALADPSKLMAFGELSEREQADLGALADYQENESAYAQQQGTRPQTLGYGLTDSPAGQCAWIVEKFKVWSDCGEHPENSFTRDELLDNVMVYWLSASAASSARLYWHSVKHALSTFPETKVPVAYSAFPKEIVRLSERWAQTRYPGLAYSGEPARGGHFAAFEQPELFVAEVRAGLAALGITAAG